MKKILLLVTVFYSGNAIAQQASPYAMFGHSSSVTYKEKAVAEMLYIRNADSNATVKAIAFNMEKSTALLLDKDDRIIDTLLIKPEEILRWTSVDPKAKEFPQWSPYAAMADNPIRNIDPDGQKFYNFNAQGDYTGTSHDNIIHNLFFRQGRIIDNNGDVVRQFRFADRKNDTREIESGIITKVIVVTDAQIQSLVSKSGGFNHENKTANRGLTFNDRYGYILKEGKGNGKMDFSYSQLRKIFPDASTNPLKVPSTMLFLPPRVDGQADYAHNHMNFGNYLYGASGQAQGFTSLELTYGAHYNGVKNAQSNGYEPSLDSNDDQFSIMKGYMYGQSQNYDQKEYKVTVDPATHSFTPPPSTTP